MNIVTYNSSSKTKKWSKIIKRVKIMARKLKKFYKSKEGKKLLKENLKEIEEEQKNKTGWFSKEEDEYWEGIGD